MLLSIQFSRPSGTASHHCCAEDAPRQRAHFSVVSNGRLRRNSRVSGCVVFVRSSVSLLFVRVVSDAKCVDEYIFVPTVSRSVLRVVAEIVASGHTPSLSARKSAISASVPLLVNA